MTSLQIECAFRSISIVLNHFVYGNVVVIVVDVFVVIVFFLFVFFAFSFKFKMIVLRAESNVSI